MFTQCPHCMTLFRITPEQLKAAEGRVRCCQCNQIFNALQRLQEFPKAFNNLATTSQYVEMAQPDEDEDAVLLESPEARLDRPDSTLINDSEVERTLDDLADDSTPLVPSLSEDSNLEDDQLSPDTHSQMLFEQDDGLEPEPEYFAEGTESQMSELLDQDSASLLLQEEDYSQTDLAEIIELDIPQPELRQSSDALEPASELESSHISADLELEDTPELEEEPPLAADSEVQQTTPQEEQPHDEPAEEHASAIAFEPGDEERRHRRNNLLWLLGSLLLVLPLAGQIAWQMRDRLIYNDKGRLLLNTLCDVAGCSVPMRRATDKIVIIQRALTAHPEKPDVLLMQLEIVNTASFPQPYPKLQLSLYNDMEKLIARRTFNPEEYLDLPTQRLPMLNKQTTTHILLELVDPGSEVTGFKFDFI